MTVINEIPFFHGSCKFRGNEGAPESFPIDIYYDNKFQIFRQRNNASLSKLLYDIYLNGSLVDGSISNESGNLYLDKLTTYVINHLRCKIEDAKILEIGCGKGVILKCLQKKGAINLTGIEPGNYEIEKDSLKGINIIKDFFPTLAIQERVDAIIHFAVWEHIEDPVTFIKNQLQQLTENGIIVFGVPNCEKNLEDGDISIFIHEHFNYFTKTGLEKVANAAGGILTDIIEIYGMLVGVIERGDSSPKQHNYTFKEDVFWRQASNNIAKLKGFIERYKNQSDIAVFVPGRALNYLYTINADDVRIVDDNSEMLGKYFPYLKRRVESSEDIKHSPPKAIIIFSKTFGKKIKDMCLSQSELSETTVICFDEL